MKPTTNVIPGVFRDSLEGMGMRAVRKVVLVRREYIISRLRYTTDKTF